MRDAGDQDTHVIRWPDPPRAEDDTIDAVRMYEQMWSIERIAGLFGTNYDAMHRLIGRHARLRSRDRYRRAVRPQEG